MAVLERGFNAVVTARDPSRVRDLVAGHPDTALALPLDVTDAAQVAAAVTRAEDRFGGIDVLFNTAGPGSFGPFAGGRAAPASRAADGALTRHPPGGTAGHEPIHEIPR